MKCRLTHAAANFTIDIMTWAATEEVLRKELADMEPSITNLKKLDLDNFDDHEIAFLNFLGQAFGVLQESLHYIVCPETVPDEFANAQEEHMFQLLLTRDAYQLDNHTVYRKLKAFLINSTGWAWAWIEPHDSDEGGCAAFKA